MEEKIGMHMHSCHSDGSCTPYQLVRRIFSAGVKAACLTDHDTIGGVEEFQFIAEKFGIETVAGVEVSAHWEKRNFVHILAYGIDYLGQGSFLRKKLARNLDAHCNMVNRMMKRVEEKFCVNFSIDEIALATGQRGPVNFYLPTLRFLQKQLNLKENEFARTVFADGLSSFDEAVTEGQYLSIQEAMETIHAAGGKAVLAHPGLFRKYTVRGAAEKQDFEKLLSELVALGLCGIETYYIKHTSEQTRYFEELAARYGLWQTAGSDYHGDYAPENGLMQFGISLEEFRIFKAFCES